MEVRSATVELPRSDSTRPNELTKLDVLAATLSEGAEPLGHDVRILQRPRRESARSREGVGRVRGFWIELTCV